VKVAVGGPPGHGDRAGLKVECALDEQTYETGIRISKAEMRQLAIEGDAFHPEWNYTIKPRRSGYC
jgi:hypothetical protein